ncbi:DUF342 domain-containing protein [Sporosarcina sp. BI001-red]|uniref:DUF342 domain-containing protein n=1 Tax=Sporosarcina sp. BI001-red TaxID=2282866 RepID=UPI000E222F7A|nr:FapA family protein [Sporosarcina sp. BI001-red]REB10070.1 DUF342 domain-containing protein [Sporosarcina sp. BI001-red]
MIFENDYITLTRNENIILMHTKKSGFPIKSFEKITQELPRLKITSFPELRRVLSTEGNEGEIANYAPAIEIIVSSDKMRAEAEIYLTAEEIDKKKHELPSLVADALKTKGIQSGQTNINWNAIKTRQSIIVAEGEAPIKGEDAAITYIEVPDRRPVIREDGSADYYEMNFVTPIKKGDWLGEKVHAQEGTNGRDIFGTEILSKKGLDNKLYYDRKSVEEVEEDGKTVLRAIRGGVLEFENGVVGIGQQLIINGDVGPETGSITFDGTVIISGTIHAGYSVNATGDISVGAKEGVTHAKEVRSEKADVYIKGGVFGGGSTVIEAKGSIFIKHANECNLYAHTVQIGLYLLGSQVIADYVYVDRYKGRIIGGSIEAKYRIECAFAGNRHERETVLYAKGVDKEALHIDVQRMAQSIKNLQKQIVQLETHIEPLEKVVTALVGPQREAYDKIRDTLTTSREEVFVFDQAIQTNLHIMKTAVAPQIEITQEANAGVTIQIGSRSSTIESPTKGVFEMIDGVLNI